LSSRAKQILMDLMLLVVAFFWGSTFIIVKNAVALVDAFSFLAVRFSLSFFLMLALFPKRFFPIRPETAKAGILLGVVLYTSFGFQTWGLTVTSATNGAFITGLNIVMVPLFSLVFLKKAPAPSAMMGVIAAFLGLYILLGGAPSEWNRGDLQVFVCAVAVAFHILLTGYYAPQMDAFALVTWQLGTAGLLGVILSLANGGVVLVSAPQVWAAILITAVFCTVFAFVVQTLAQRVTTPTRAALIFTAEPVFGALFAHFYGDEPLYTYHLAGGGLIFLGMILAEIRPRMWNRMVPENAVFHRFKTKWMKS